MKIIFSLSKRSCSKWITDANGSIIQTYDGCRVMVRVFEGSKINLRAKTEIYVDEAHFKDGCIIAKERVNTPIRQHFKSEGERLEKLRSTIDTAFNKADKSNVQGDWLSLIVDKFFHPDKYLTEAQKNSKKTATDWFEEYLSKNDFSYDHTKAIKVLARDVSRYERFRNKEAELGAKKSGHKATGKIQTFRFDVKTITRNDIEDFFDYLKNEKALSEEPQYRAFFKKMLSEYPAGIGGGQRKLVDRGDNALIKLKKKLKSFFRWLNDTERIHNMPFEGITIGTEQYGTPYYITIEERNKIAGAPMPTKHLETQRDIFIFQCFIGCRVSDLMRLTSLNIHNGILEYQPHKTKDEGQQSVTARIPLHPKALALIEKYKGVDKKGRLLPCISAQKYNVAIKEVFTIAGITRNVVVRNATTGEEEIRPINEIASSHLARRTFVGNAYKMVSDPNIIGKMSGHVEGSKAFARYRDIDNEMLTNVINMIG